MIPKYKDIMDLVKKGATIEAQEKIIELREAALELQDENYDLKQKINELNIELKKKKTLVWEKPSYWDVYEKVKDGPFCQRCYDVEKEIVRLQGGNDDTWHCTACKSRYHGPNYISPKRKVRRSVGVVI